MAAGLACIGNFFPAQVWVVRRDTFLPDTRMVVRKCSDTGMLYRRGDESKEYTVMFRAPDGRKTMEAVGRPNGKGDLDPTPMSAKTRMQWDKVHCDGRRLYYDSTTNMLEQLKSGVPEDKDIIKKCVARDFLDR